MMKVPVPEVSCLQSRSSTVDKVAYLCTVITLLHPEPPRKHIGTLHTLARDSLSADGRWPYSLLLLICSLQCDL